MHFWRFIAFFSCFKDENFERKFLFFFLRCKLALYGLPNLVCTLPTNWKPIYISTFLRHAIFLLFEYDFYWLYSRTFVGHQVLSSTIYNVRLERSSIPYINVASVRRSKNSTNIMSFFNSISVTNKLKCHLCKSLAPLDYVRTSQSYKLRQVLSFLSQLQFLSFLKKI